MIATATGGTLARRRCRSAAIDGFAIDSRTLQPGDLFFAIVAARDGHEFVADAIARGAAGAVVVARLRVAADRAVRPIAGRDRGRRHDAALQDLGAVRAARIGGNGRRHHRQRRQDDDQGNDRDVPRRVGIAVVKNNGNLNNHLGLPLSLLELRHGADIAVMELGMNHAGEIRLLVGIAEPDVRVWTNVGDAHLGYFASRDAIADAKAEILEDAHGRRRAGLQRRRSARDGAHRRLRRPRDHVRRRRADGRRARRRRSRTSASTARGFGCARRHGDGRRARAAARPRQPVERARGGRGGARARACRSPRSPSARRTLAPVAASRRSRAARRTASRSSTTPTTRARRR